ncbi:MAG: DUF1648 domain-containing protein [Chloroflexi bacterium]|nr:DUF1648 domain-containing protein [Chloroflexota bacterium]
MSVFIVIILVALLLLVLGGGAVIFFVFRRATIPAVKPVGKQGPPIPPKPAAIQKPATGTLPQTPLTFRWSYAALPLAILAIYIIITAVFYPKLPAEIGYRFSDGKPDSFASREAVVAIGLAIQLFFAIVSVALSWGVTRFRALSQTEGVWISPQRILWFMGNMVAMPQAVLAFAMADIFSYNSFRVHLVPVWVFALIVMGVGGLVIGGIFIMVILRALAGSGRASR